MAISINPSMTVAPPSSFLASTNGYTQGIALADPTSRLWLLSGVLGSGVTGSVWGGEPITENLSADAEASPGSTVVLATSIANITGFTVFDKAYNMVVTPGNTVPVASAGMSVAYFRLGSNIRIPVPASAALIAALSGAAVNVQTIWNFTNNNLDVYASGTALPVKVVGYAESSKVVNYDSGTGVVSWTSGAVAVIQL